MLLYASVAEEYLDFARHAAADSPCFADWATQVAGDRDVLAWLDALPTLKRQPNLVFAAARWHGVPAPGPYDALRAALLDDDGTLRATVLARSTQTNEVGRLATTVPLLAQVAATTDRPLALVEVGASAGLTLYPDRVAYRWSGSVGGSLHPAPGGGWPPPPVLACATSGPVPLPRRPVEVAWRGGLDLHPLDVCDDDAVAWLEQLVWPEDEARRERLRAAVAVARHDPPVLVRGDLLDDLPALVETAARHGEVVVVHSAVLAYVRPEERPDFVATARELVTRGACHWISNEGPQVLPEVTATGPAVPADLATFVLGLDGCAVAWTHPHGRSLHWL
ncbi:DUF2332 domain-containing protein [Nocardioides perillae]|uniref:DUF2332 domain-containing protein n=1 Tax=Nocardioides perillae TaxID=1119534 RepID=A0A7Y9RRU3_9ACTN|nr:DUF2332 domain-containing protein [Nocardioides perillae]NYG54076.1 hypothetical protein [Nocardioides perillae]